MTLPTNIILAGCIHAPPTQTKTSVRMGKLIAPSTIEGFHDFLQEVSKPRTLLCREGMNEPLIMPPTHPNYAARLDWVCDGIGEWGLTPDLLMCDKRWEGKKQEERNKLATEHAIFLSQIAPELVQSTCPTMPTNAEELVELVQREQCRVRLLHQPPGQWARIARQVYRDFDRFDESHIRRLSITAPNYDVCVVVCGAGHALSLHLKTWWPLRLFLRPGSESEDCQITLVSYLYHTVAAQLIGGLKAK